jgi:hypothetical protein
MQDPDYMAMLSLEDPTIADELKECVGFKDAETARQMLELVKQSVLEPERTFELIEARVRLKGDGDLAAEQKRFIANKTDYMAGLNLIWAAAEPVTFIKNRGHQCH